MIRTLLSVGVGAPIALVCMTLWFLIELLNLSGRKRPELLDRAAVVTTAVLIFMVVARFLEYA
jgi:hypothetical protein